jgi:hypothetical protein
LLDNALDCGIAESDFWQMTFAELERAAASKNRRDKAEAQNRAAYDYILAGLIGRAFAQSMSQENTFPTLHEAYPHLFDGEQQKAAKEEQIIQLSTARFKAFAQSYNKKFEEEAGGK